ncbi:hypothetical protein PBAL39_22430 [Pedobacter sp. BAL39]|uniref:hypothetical protein n=1 Tax=Pedobacter sp. BAL39 TaxID=391596 RepID=UPI00015596B3|nr:hypothetical protein [Pedobacter sp. BAL39]EDM38877.1 hypothetical protein PBAL39_22430 [Pedobacter sp. BAL39]
MKTYINSSNLKLEIIFQVMKKRIAKGFKSSDLSFLIGKEHNYIDGVESLVIPSYTIQDLDFISEALEEQINPSPDDTDIKEYPLFINMERHLFESRYFHICTSYSSVGHAHVYFILTEDADLRPKLVFAQMQYDQRDLVKQKIAKMREEGYFEQPKWPYQIYQHVSRTLGLTIDPRLLKDLLDNFCQGDGLGGLKKQYDNDRYQYVFNVTRIRSILAKSKSL